jgi:hypothetical protein
VRKKREITNNIGAKGRLKIVDPKKLAAILTREIKARHGGSVLAAARTCGISQPVLHRLSHAQSRFVRFRTLAQLRAFLGEASPLIDRCVLSSDAQAYLAVYEEWLDRRWFESLYGASWWGAKHGRMFRFKGADAAVRRLFGFGALLAHVRKHCAEQLMKLESALDGKSQKEQRFIYWRVLEPLMDAREAAFVPKSPFELKRSQLQAFVAASVRRELLLLDKKSVVVRAQVVAERSVESLQKADALAFAPVSFFAEAMQRPWARIDQQRYMDQNEQQALIRLIRTLHTRKGASLKEAMVKEWASRMFASHRSLR